jgi:hypothetical protein
MKGSSKKTILIRSLALVLTVFAGCFFKSNFIIAIIALVITLLVLSFADKSWIFPVVAVLVVIFGFIGVSMPDLIYKTAYNLPDMSTDSISHEIRMGQVGWTDLHKLETNLHNTLPHQTAVPGGADAAYRAKVYALDVMSHPASSLRFFAKKFVVFWDNPDFGGSTYGCIQPARPIKILAEVKSFYCNDRGVAVKVVTQFDNGYTLIVFSFGLIGILAIRKRKGIDNLALYYALLTVVGGTFFHLIFETKDMYALPYFVLLIPFAVSGLEKAFNHPSLSVPLSAGMPSR